MRIPSGDLAPARKSSRRGVPLHGRPRQRSRAVPVVVSVVLLAGIGIGAAVWRDDDRALLGSIDSAVSGRLVTGGQSPAQAAAGSTPVCPTPATAVQPAPAVRPNTPPNTSASAPPARAVVLPPPGSVAVQLLNGTDRDGLGRRVGAELAKRGFKVAGTGNAPAPLPGPSRVYFGPGGRPAAQAVAMHVTGAELSPMPAATPRSINVVLGSGFQRVRTPAEVTVVAARLRQPAPVPPAPGCG